MEKKSILGGLTKLVVILLIILISAISFLGIYKKNLNKWENMVPEFNLSKELGEARTFGFEVSTATKEVDLNDDKKEAESNEEQTSGEKAETEESATPTETTTPSETTAPSETAAPSENADATQNAEATDKNADLTVDDKDYSAEPATTEVPVNKQEDLNNKNYKKAKSIVENRLKDFGIYDEIITVDETTGKLSIIVPQSRMTDYAVALVTSQGKLEIVDSDTEEVLINNDMISKVTATYNQSSTTSTNGSNAIDMGINLQFKNDGQKKLNEISKKYVETVNEDGETVQKTVTVRIDDEDKYKTYFDASGEYTSIFVPLFREVDTSDTKTANDNYNDCLVAQSSINGGMLPIKYELTTGTYMKSNLGDNFTRNAVIVIAVILSVIALYMLLKYGKKGLIIDIIELGFVAILLLLIRAANVSISLAGLVTILLMSILNYHLASLLTKKNKVKHFGKFLLRIFPLLITILVFVFAKDINANSLGMVGFWSLIGFVYTFIVSLILLKKTNKEGADEDEE